MSLRFIPLFGISYQNEYSFIEVFQNQCPVKFPLVRFYFCEDEFYLRVCVCVCTCVYACAHVHTLCLSVRFVLLFLVEAGISPPERL